MTYVEQAIRDAVEHQWDFEHSDRDGLAPKLAFSRNEIEDRKYGLEMRAIYVDAKGKEYGLWVVFKHWARTNCYKAFLDPAFWQALGKARGWNTLRDSCGGYNTSEASWGERKAQKGCSSCNSHRFIDHLAGEYQKDPEHYSCSAAAESFFASL